MLFGSFMFVCFVFIVGRSFEWKLGSRNFSYSKCSHSRNCISVLRVSLPHLEHIDLLVLDTSD